VLMKLYLDLQKRKLAATTESMEPISMAAQPPHVLAEYLSSMQAKTCSTMSRIELEDMQITGSQLFCHRLTLSQVDV
jgi:protein CMS1